MRFDVDFKPSALADLAHFRSAARRTILDAVRVYLIEDAGEEGRRRKRLAPNSLAPWELRVGDYRVFYEIQPESTVAVLAVGVKHHNDLFIRGKKVEL